MHGCYNRGVGPKWYEGYVKRDSNLLKDQSDVAQEDVIISWRADLKLMANYHFVETDTPAGRMSLQRLHIMTAIRDTNFCDYSRCPTVLRCCRLYHDEMLKPRTLFRPRISSFLPALKCGKELACYVQERTVEKIWEDVICHLQDYCDTPCSFDNFDFWKELQRLLSTRYVLAQGRALAWYGYRSSPCEDDPVPCNDLISYTGPITSLFPLPYHPTSPNYAALYSGFCFAILSAYFELDRVVEGVHIFEELSQLVHNLALSQCWAGHSLDLYDHDVQYGQSLATHYLAKKCLPFPRRETYPGWGHRLLP
jgi:hypothetical protein